MGNDALRVIRDALRELLDQDNRPVLFYTGLFAIARAFEVPREQLARILLDVILETVGPNRTLLMPSYTNGYRDGVIDLDAEPCTTGMINELLRCMPGTARTASAFFSFVARGPDSSTLEALRPVDAWGDGSVFDWIEKQDAQVCMVGVPWQMCSFIHSVEWKARVLYRHQKTFSGTMIYQGNKSPLTETLFVRSLDPLVRNAWPGLDETLAAAGMKSCKLGQSQVAVVGSRAMVKSLLPLVMKDPFAFVQDPVGVRQQFLNRV